MRAIGSVLRVIDFISDWTGKILIWALLLLIVILVYAVIMRYVVNDPVIWAHETALFMFGGLGILMGAYVLRHKGHIRMDLFYNRLSSRKRAILDTVTAPFFFFLIILIIWHGWDMTEWAIKTHKITDSMWHPIVWPARLTIPIGGFLLLIQGMADFVRDLYLATRGRTIK
jgi:TRAP-type mannitol/chloroaromatic compound transport system permease small subunit